MPKEQDNQQNPQSEKPVQQIQRFSSETRDMLRAQGSVVYELSGQTLVSLKDAGKPFITTIFEYPYNSPSRLSEVAFNPNELFLSGTNGKSMDKQMQALDEYNRMLRAKMSDVEAVIGSVSDYAELAFSHLEATGRFLFGPEYNNEMTRTTTQAFNTNLCVRFVKVYGFGICVWGRHGMERVSIAPLIVPSTD
ncbi:hypothetical protein HY468_04295 [Candidatus Roizmanbacteria bacterium]|nr:hypothetical protein [Candidatus Roizmanbacteria bacterium]